MSFVALQESLRKELRRQIDSGKLTGTELARRSGFTQAHISNFLNRKRGLKLVALDRMLKALGLSVYDLLNPHQLARFAAVPPRDNEEYIEVPLVESAVAASSAVIVNDAVKGLVRFPRGFLSQLRADTVTPGRKSWTRFLVITAGTEEGLSMWPRLGPGATLLVDRHYDSLRPSRKNDRNLYAVKNGSRCTVRYVEMAGSALVLRPHNAEYPVEVLLMEKEQTPADFLVGRVAHVGLET